MHKRGVGRGFTLVEMLVAIALLGLVGVIAWRGLDYIAAQRARVDRETEELGRILRVLAQLERDLDQRAPDVILPASAPAGLLPGALAVSGAGGDAALEIVRIAPSVSGPVRAQRVIYRVVDGILVRTASVPSSDWPLPVASDAVPLYEGARRLGVRAYAGGAWGEYGAPEWIAPRGRATGFEVTLEDAEGGRYVRVFAL